jgi:hypothetical protein
MWNKIGPNTVPWGTADVTGTVLEDIHDFPEYLSHSKLWLFTDDSITYRDIKTQDDCLKLQQDLDSAARWEAIGPNTVPWGTADVTGTVLEDIPFTTTVCVRSDRKAWIQSRVFSCMP